MKKYFIVLSWVFEGSVTRHKFLRSYVPRYEEYRWSHMYAESDGVDVFEGLINPLQFMPVTYSELVESDTLPCFFDTQEEAKEVIKVIKSHNLNIGTYTQTRFQIFATEVALIPCKNLGSIEV